MRLVLPSYLLPGTWLENLEAIRGLAWIEGVELLFFSYDVDARSILHRELEGIAALAERFSYSLHLPDPLRAEHEELLRLTRPFVGSYILHPPPPGREDSPRRLEDWARLLEIFRERYGEIFLLEYTDRGAFKAAEARLPGLPLCADTGHLLLEGLDPAEWIRERRARIEEIHLHGLDAGRDHAPLDPSSAWIKKLAPFLASYSGRVELEIFSLEGARSSGAHLDRVLGLAKTESPTS